MPRLMPLRPALLLLVASGLMAQNQPVRSLSVQGEGVVKLPVAALIVRCVVEGKAETPSDATTKFQSSRRRLTEALAALAIPGLAVNGQGASVKVGPKAVADQFGRQRTGEAEEVEAVVAETLVLRVADIQEVPRDDRLQLLARMLDLLTDQSVRLAGPTPPDPRYGYRPSQSDDTEPAVAFEPVDAKAQELDSFKAALADARRRADALAKVAGVTLGDVMTLRMNPAKAVWAKGEDQATVTVTLDVTWALQ